MGPIILLCSMGLSVQEPTGVLLSRGICVLYVLLFDQYHFHHMFDRFHDVEFRFDANVENK